MSLSHVYHNELNIALNAVHRASIVTKNVMRGIDAFDKSDASPVTIADFAAQALIICAIHHYFPDDTFIAEESANMLRHDPTALNRVWELVSSATDIRNAESAHGTPDILPLPSNKKEMMDLIDLGSSGSSSDDSRTDRRWILDPVDGTATFLKGQQYAVSLCLTVNEEQKVGVLGCPNLRYDQTAVDGKTLFKVAEDVVDPDGYGCVLFAIADEGSYIAPMTEDAVSGATKIKRPPTPTAIDEVLLVDFVRSSHADVLTHQKLYERHNIQRTPLDIRSMQMRYVALALGACDGMIRIPLKLTWGASVWDHAGGQLIYQETGGKLTDIYGNNFIFDTSRAFRDNCGYVAADEPLHGILLGAVNQAVMERNISTRP